MAYFFREETNFQPTQHQLLDLHSALHPRVRNHNIDLHPRWQKSAIVSNQSAATIEHDNTPVLTYFRSLEQAQQVEKLMGRDNVAVSAEVETHRHPVVEIRLTPETFAVELVVSPYAWWDQQNFVGKLELPHHRSAFRSLLRELDSETCFGFWSGTHLSDMHLTTAQLLKGRVLDEWMATFADGQDWLRIGKWYNTAELDTNTLVAEAFEAIKALHPIYNFILWTSNNNFHSFYEKRERTLRRSYI